MADIEHLLLQRSSALQPTGGQRLAAARSQNHLRDALKTGQMSGRIVRDYLAGSYARHTAIRPLDDVDIVFEIDPSGWKSSRIRSLFTSLPAPDLVLRTFTSAIRRRKSTSSVRTQGRSAGLVMERLRIDAVPAVRHESHDGWLYIPDRRTGRWIESAPRVHADVATAVNVTCGQKFKPLVRLLKGWNGSLPSTTSMKSFAVESIALHVMRSHPVGTLFDGMIRCLDFIAYRGGEDSLFDWDDNLGIHLSGWRDPTVPDVGGTGGNVIAGTEAAKVAKFCNSARLMRDRLRKADASRQVAAAWKLVGPRVRGGLKRV